MLGHYHGGFVSGNICYPRSPEPLTWGETRRHAVSVLALDEGDAKPELVDINQLRFDQVSGCGGAASSVEVEERPGAALDSLADPQLGLAVLLTGEVQSECEISTVELVERYSVGFAALKLENRVVFAFELEAIAVEPTAHGRFVRKLLDLAEAQPELGDRARAAAHAGLRALHTRGQIIDPYAIPLTEGDEPRILDDAS